MRAGTLFTILAVAHSSASCGDETCASNLDGDELKLMQMKAVQHAAETESSDMDKWSEYKSGYKHGSYHQADYKGGESQKPDHNGGNGGGHSSQHANAGNHKQGHGSHGKQHPSSKSPSPSSPVTAATATGTTATADTTTAATATSTTTTADTATAATATSTTTTADTATATAATTTKDPCAQPAGCQSLAARFGKDIEGQWCNDASRAKVCPKRCLPECGATTTTTTTTAGRAAATTTTLIHPCSVQDASECRGSNLAQHFGQQVQDQWCGVPALAQLCPHFCGLCSA